MKANFIIIEDDFLKEEPLVIQDVGPWDKYQTVTNAAEEVVLWLVAGGHLPRGRRLLYIDTDGHKDEIVHADGRFVAFKTGPR
jgi:hypothetical protein